jgi:hypothetical protein
MKELELNDVDQFSKFSCFKNGYSMVVQSFEARQGWIS